MSLLEDCLLSEMLAAGVPAPVREYPFAGVKGDRKWRFDFCWPDYGLALEVQGGVWTGGRHTRGAGYENDCEKVSQAAACGFRLLLVTARMIEDGRALRLILWALGLGSAASVGVGVPADDEFSRMGKGRG